MRPVLFGIAGTLLLAIAWGVICSALRAGPAIAFLGGMVVGGVGMLGGMALGARGES